MHNANCLFKVERVRRQTKYVTVVVHDGDAVFAGGEVVDGGGGAPIAPHIHIRWNATVHICGHGAGHGTGVHRYEKAEGGRCG